MRGDHVELDGFGAAGTGPGLDRPGKKPSTGRRPLGAVPGAAIPGELDRRPERNCGDPWVGGIDGRRRRLEAPPDPERLVGPALDAVDPPAEWLLAMAAELVEWIGSRLRRCFGAGRLTRLDRRRWSGGLGPRLEDRDRDEEDQRPRENARWSTGPPELDQRGPCLTNPGLGWVVGRPLVALSCRRSAVVALLALVHSAPPAASRVSEDRSRRRI